jgi:hypothetical protein
VRRCKLTLMLCVCVWGGGGARKSSTKTKTHNFIYAIVVMSPARMFCISTEHLRKVICVKLIPCMLNNDINVPCLQCCPPSIKGLNGGRPSHHRRSLHSAVRHVTFLICQQLVMPRTTITGTYHYYTMALHSSCSMVLWKKRKITHELGARD